MEITWKKYLGPKVRQQQGKLSTPENEICNKGTVVAHASADSGSSGEKMLLVLSQDLKKKKKRITRTKKSMTDPLDPLPAFHDASIMDRVLISHFYLKM